MDRSCAICRDYYAIDIDERLIAGDSIEDIVHDFHLSRKELIRHARYHILSADNYDYISALDIFCHRCERPEDHVLFIKMVQKGNRFFPVCNDCLEPGDCIWPPFYPR